ncbi:MAG: ATP-binding protein, partial [Actinomycetota bacterium]
MLHGRDVERTRLAMLLDEARQARAGALVVRGDAGVGKSALLDDLVAMSPGVLVLRTQGLESESPLPFAALHRLLRPLTDLVDQLPVPQARALRLAFGEEDGESVEPFLVAVATLSLLTGEAEAGALLCIVDDAHWLDSASADALLFVARRVQADRVALVFGVRDGDVRTFEASGVPALRLTGLDDSAARAVLADRIGADVPDEVATRLLEQANGNPLALVELPSGLTASQLQGAARIPAQLPLTVTVERVFLDRCRRLPSDVQTLLLVAAADDSGQLATLRKAAAALGVGDGA